MLIGPRRLQITRVAPRATGHGVHRGVDVVPADVRPDLDDALAILRPVRLQLEEAIADIDLDEILVVIAQLNAHWHVGRLPCLH